MTAACMRWLIENAGCSFVTSGVFSEPSLSVSTLSYKSGSLTAGPGTGKGSIFSSEEKNKEKPEHYSSKTTTIK